MKQRMIAAMVVVLMIGLVGCGGPEERKAKHRLKAQEYFEQGNYPKARVALRNVLKIDPKDSEAYFLYAQVEEKEKNWRNAVGAYQQVLELNPDHERALIKIGKYYLEARAVDMVGQMTDRVLAKNPKHVGAQALKIAAMALSGQLAEATVKAEQLIADAPTEVDAVLLLASLYTAQQQADRALPLLQRGLEAHPDSLELLDAQAMTLVRQGQLPEAEAILRRIVSLEPKILDHRLRLVAFYDHQRQYEKAETMLREAIQADPDNEERRLAMAEYIATRRGVKEAETSLQQAQKDLPHSAKIQFALGTLYEKTQRVEQARTAYESIRSDFKGKPESLEAQVKLAAIDWQAGKQDAAESHLKEILKENPRAADALLLRGKIALQRGNGKDATLDFRSVLKDQPESAEVQLLLGRAYLMTGETVLARESLEKAASLKPMLTQAQLLLASLDAAGGKLKEARRRLDPLIARDPGNLMLLGVLFQLQVQEKEWEGTQQTLERLRTAGADRMKADLAEGHVAAAQQQWDKAEASYRRAVTDQPKAAEPLLALVRLGVQRGQMQRTQATLEALVAEQPTHPYAAGFLGEVLLMKGDAAAALPQFETATKLNPKWTTPWVHLAQHHYANQQGEAGDAVLMKALEASPDSEQLRIMLATSFETRDRVDEAIAQYETVLKHHPKSLLAANNLASTLVDRKGDPDSLQRALTLSRDFETVAPNPYLLDTLGWTHLKLGHHQEALRLVKQAMAKVKDHPVLNYHLGVIYAQSGEKKEARAHLSQALQGKQTFPWTEEAKIMLAKLDG
ncbi:MAG: tetratricopeptide repeat protein [Nitrospira sp.]|nr:tetratricopeptide repeat protein [Nitrospira sp.]